jgi:hypothetical protein
MHLAILAFEGFNELDSLIDAAESALPRHEPHPAFPAAYPNSRTRRCLTQPPRLR